MSRSKFTNRRLFFYTLFILSSSILIISLIKIQLLDDSYKMSAENNVIKAVNIYPERGYIYDRNGILLVSNQRAYDLMVIPRQVKTLDTLNFCQIVGIEKQAFEKKISKAAKYSKHRPSILIKEVSKKTAAQLLEKLYEFPGFYLQERTMRDYPEHSGGNILGYVSQVPDYILKKK